MPTHTPIAGPTEPVADPAPRRWRPWLWVFGLVLLIAALGVVAQRGDDLARAREAAQAAHWSLVLIVLTLPLANWIVSSLVFWILTVRYGRVGLDEMILLIGAAWLLNHLPLRPGLVGRVAYHKRVNGIRVRDSALVVLQSLLAGLAAALPPMLAGAAALALGAPDWTLPAALVAWAAGLSAWGLLLRARAPAPAEEPPSGPTAPDSNDADDESAADEPSASRLARAWQAARDPAHAWRLVLVTGLRAADLAIWTVRYWALLELVGAPVTLAGAAALALVGNVVMLAPVQLGVREWAIGVARSFLPAAGWTGGAGPGIATGGQTGGQAGGQLAGEGVGDVGGDVGLGPGLLAAVVNRGAELVLSAPVGLACSWILARRARVRSNARGDRDE